jgi:hypothetical protein
MADKDEELLHVNGQTFDMDDLTYGERREIRRLIRNELWDESVDGEFDWDEVTPDDIVAVTVLVMMRREDPQFTLEQALACKPNEVTPPPTKSTPKRSSSRPKASADSGSQS